ncbi:hypothetical protein BDK51DRAFT_50629 [Blyttiomyces helicus]|uniref:Uncharacterized protein n=1 Tax=Blyttiomyces helicus TaxID=388810 RepID=A0A4P9WNA3_9FUNG|nr:hypothetical protein BDK51DRAFT_50629 [Blyttiomyces helicus]|eukprot:RKO92690.1 hypothetical protein BDK51DRAFT_50629 [Blyttiomyces helicus]
MGHFSGGVSADLPRAELELSTTITTLVLDHDAKLFLFDLKNQASEKVTIFTRTPPHPYSLLALIALPFPLPLPIFGPSVTVSDCTSKPRSAGTLRLHVHIMFNGHVPFHGGDVRRFRDEPLGKSDYLGALELGARLIHDIGTPINDGSELETVDVMMVELDGEISTIDEHIRAVPDHHFAHVQSLADVFVRGADFVDDELAVLVYTAAETSKNLTGEPDGREVASVQCECRQLETGEDLGQKRKRARNMFKVTEYKEETTRRNSPRYHTSQHDALPSLMYLEMLRLTATGWWRLN